MLREFEKRLEHDKMTARLREEPDNAASLNPESANRPEKIFISMTKSDVKFEEFDRLASFFFVSFTERSVIFHIKLIRLFIIVTARSELEEFQTMGLES
jgi:hypothetical protein